MLGIINYNMGNLASVYNACYRLNKEAHIITKPEELKNYERIILPGVGAFGDAMEHINKTGMNEAILEFAKSGKPIFGVCLGMQLLFNSSNEFGFHKGLGLIDGEVVKFDKSKMCEDTKIPHMGWNTIINKNCSLFEDLENPYLYFVHSYHIQTDDKYVLGYTNYGYDFASAVAKDNIYGLQPHPEKSHENGLKILENFLKIK